MKNVEIKEKFTGKILISGKYESKKDALEKNTGADLTGADLTGADLTGAYLRGAYLTGADLTGADLTGADLTGADLRGADLAGAKGISKYLITQLLFLRDQVGKLRLYKLVNEKNEGIYRGGLKYIIGKTVTVKESDPDETKQCSYGISVATLDWCIKNWQQGYKILVVEFTAKDISAIPLATDGKIRVKKCLPIREKNLKELGLIKDQ